MITREQIEKLIVEYHERITVYEQAIPYAGESSKLYEGAANMASWAIRDLVELLGIDPDDSESIARIFMKHSNIKESIKVQHIIEE